MKKVWDKQDLKDYLFISVCLALLNSYGAMRGGFALFAVLLAGWCLSILSELKPK